MLLRDVLEITRALENILLEEAEPLRNSRLDALAKEVVSRFGESAESKMIVEGIRSWMRETHEAGEAI